MGKVEVVELSVDGNRVRVYGRVSPDTRERVKYWADARNQSEGDFVSDAIEFFISHLNGDYDLPTLEIERLNQLTDVIVELTTADRALSAVVTNGFDALLSMARGTNYLLEEDEGIFDPYAGEGLVDE